MLILRRIVSSMIMVVSWFLIVMACINYDWSTFASIFNNFGINTFVNELNQFLSTICNGVILFTLSLLGITISDR